MTLYCLARYRKDRTQFGIFHNVGVVDEETGFIHLHFFGMILALLWSRS